MGCASSKQFHDDNLRDELKIKPRKGSSSSLRRLVSSSSSKRREELEEEEERVVIANAERSSSLRLIPETQNNNTSILAQSGKADNKPNTATEGIGHHIRRRSRAHGTGFDSRVVNRIDDEEVKVEGKLNSNLNSNSLSLRGDVPNGVEASWPRWLTDVAGEAVRGWVPRKAESFEKLDKIGQGTYSSVYRARDLETGKIVALKKVRFANMDPESVKFMAREIHILRRLDHPNIIKLEGLVTSRMSSSLYLVFEYMEHDLAGLAATPGLKFTEPQVKCYMQQLLSGLDHCHTRGVLHRDIKGANLLISNDGILKIADFGLATFFNPNHRQQLTSRVVTLWYRPPELLLGSTNYGPAVDLWSAGCILAELLAGKPIMPGRTEVEQLHKIFKLCGSPSEEFWASLKLSRAAIFKPQHPYRRCFNDTYRDFPPSALSLLDRLLGVEPKSRGTAASSLQSEFFNTKPYACHPSELPKYPPSKEYNAKLRDEEARRQRAAASKGRDADMRRKQLPVPDAHAELKHWLVQVNPKGSSYKFTPKEDGASGVPIDPPRVVPENSFPHRAGPAIPHLAHTGRTTSNIGRPSNGHGQVPRYNGPDLTNFSGPIGMGARGGVVRMDSMKESMNKQGNKTGSRFSSYTGGASSVVDYTSHLLERPSTSQRKDEPIANKESHVVNGAKKNRIHYSGPLMPPGGNMDEMLKEHDRHIQQTVRRARFDKSKVKLQLERDQSEALLFAAQNGRSDR